MARPSRPKRKPRPRRKAPIPRNAARRARSPQPPRAVELFLIAAIKRVAAKFAKTVARILYPRLADFAKPPAEEEKTDAARFDAPPDGDAPDADDIDEMVSELRDATARAFDEDAVLSSSSTAAKRTVLHSKSEFERCKIKITAKKEPNLKHLINGWSRDLLARVRGVQTEGIDRIHAILTDGYSMRHETLAKRIAEQVEGVSQSRAEFLARDAVLTLNGKITQERQTAAGIEEYVFTTSSDERVREDHEALEGLTFSWDDPPDVGHPGEDFLCRCSAFPVLPELTDDADTGE